MDIGLTADLGIIIKAKNATFVVDPKDVSRAEADCAIFLRENGEGKAIPEGMLAVQGPGDYEVGGVKIFGTKIENNMYFILKTGNLDALIIKSSALEAMKDKLPQVKVLILNVESQINESLISEALPAMLIVYGANTGEIEKITKGKEKVRKISIKQDRLLQEMETVALG